MEEGYAETGTSALSHLMGPIHCTSSGVPLYWPYATQKPGKQETGGKAYFSVTYTLTLYRKH